MTEEHRRLEENARKSVPLATWGPYLGDRQWGTVREDYSADGNAWHYFPFDHAAFRAYLWGEDGLGGISDIYQNLCFAIALWNGKDPILKERLFGLRNGEGNHGEDVKELYFHLDNLPTHYYMEFLYKYPQQEFPYEKLREVNRHRSLHEPEYELLDTGIFDQDEYFDVRLTYAKEADEDIFIRVDITNRYARTAEITLLPTLWFYNRWRTQDTLAEPSISFINKTCVKAEHSRLENYYFYFPRTGTLLFTDNETNTEKVSGIPNKSPFTKDAFHEAIIHGQNLDALRNRKKGTKCAPVYRMKVGGGATRTLYFRLTRQYTEQPFPKGFKQVFDKRKQEADAFYASLQPGGISGDLARIRRQALAGLLWSKQYYHYDVEEWLTRADGISPLAPGRLTGRNHDWRHLKNQDVISMPDKWEYPWYAAWDMAFQAIAMATVDPTFAKHQLLLIMREWYMKPDGQLPSYEWNFSDVNPPVHAWAAMQVYRIEKQRRGMGDLDFLKKIFHKLMINFTWWINRKDRKGNNIFEGGFLGLDNIGVFNRNHLFSEETRLEQADGTAWMGTYAIDMMEIAIEIAMHDQAYEDMATKFFEHFVLIAEALNEHRLWNEEDKFFYDVLVPAGSDPYPLRIQSIVGLTSLFAVTVMSHEVFQKLPDFYKRISWFENYRKKHGKFWPNEQRSDGKDILLSLVRQDRLKHLLQRLLSESDFLSPGGIRALSKHHEEHPFSVTIDGIHYGIRYDPGDSTSDIYGGNSNWRGPVWMPINYLIIESLRSYGAFYGDEFKVECPTGSGRYMNLCEVADELTRRVISLFEEDENGYRRIYGVEYGHFFRKPENRHLLQFYEYFHGDTGRGLGASHQTGWTALVAELIAGHGAAQKPGT